MTLIDPAPVIHHAHEIRQRAGLAGPPYSARKLIEACFPDVLVTGLELPRGITAALEVRRGKKTIFYSRNVGHPAQRVGIIHEIGHLIFDVRRKGFECGINFRAAERTTVEIERRAEMFAAEVLVPIADLHPMIKVLFPKDPAEQHIFEDECDTCASRFNVPRGFLRWRLWDLYRVRQSNYSPPDLASATKSSKR